VTSRTDPTALAAGARHGYAIMTDVAGISEGRVRLRPGSLYAALNRLLVEGLVEFDREEIVDGRLRRYYRLTDQGAAQIRNSVSTRGSGRRESNPHDQLGRLGLCH
jgi:DNA-binding PadR family transcriptional regulator